MLPEEIENMILVKVIFPRNPRNQQSQHLLGHVRTESKGLEVKVRQKPTGKQMVIPHRRCFVVHLLLQEQHSEFGVNVLTLHQDVFFPKYFTVLTLKASPGVLFQYQQHQIVPQGSPGSLAAVHTRTPQGYIHISLPKESRAQDIRKGMHSLCGFFTQCQDVVKMPSFDKDCSRDLEKNSFQVRKRTPHPAPKGLLLSAVLCELFST